jgi:DNA-binding transcriptional regulator YiaG
MAMEKIEIANLLRESPHLQWQTLRGEQQLVRWLPIIDVSRKGYYLGLTEEGIWVSDSRDQLIRLGKNGFFVPLLPLLEQDYEAFLSHFKASLKNFGLPYSIISTLPLLDAVTCGLEHGSDYWAALALKWIESCKKLQTIELIPKLEKVLKAKWASQPVRQKSKRLLVVLAASKPTETIPIQKIRQVQHLSKEQLASILLMAPASISQLESRMDMYMSTVRRYIEAMGGKLDIIAHFPDGEVRINTFSGVQDVQGTPCTPEP